MSLYVHKRRATIRANGASQCCARALRSACRAGLMGSSRKVRSRVHGGVKETRPRLLFAPLSPSYRMMCPQRRRLTPQPPRHRTLFVFLRLLNLPPTGKVTPPITTSRVWHFASLLNSLRKPFVFGLVRSIYIPGAAVPASGGFSFEDLSTKRHIWTSIE